MSTAGPNAPLPPDPQHLVEAAAAEVNRRPLRDYADALRTLRDKGFSYREIASWLAERGVVADHNAVYRVIGEEPPAAPDASTGGGTRKPKARARLALPVQPASPPPPAFEESPLLD